MPILFLASLTLVNLLETKNMKHASDMNLILNLFERILFLDFLAIPIPLKFFSLVIIGFVSGFALTIKVNTHACTILRDGGLYSYIIMMKSGILRVSETYNYYTKHMQNNPGE